MSVSPGFDVMIELISTHRGDTQMHRIEMIEGTGGMRALTESEVAMVGGGGFWSNLIDTVVTVVECISPTAQLAGYAGVVAAGGKLW
jgi:hypothetical protein